VETEIPFDAEALAFGDHLGGAKLDGRVALRVQDVRDDTLLDLRPVVVAQRLRVLPAALQRVDDAQAARVEAPRQGRTVPFELELGDPDLQVVGNRGEQRKDG
jgi:hypothetical protein